jgi:uncharacterized protein YqeY
MGLKEQIGDDLKSAMKAGDRIRLETLRTLRAALMEKEIEKRGSGKPLSPEDEIAVLTSSAKKRRESMELFEKGGRPELVEQEGKELSIIQEYLPRQMSPEEVMKVIEQAVDTLGASGQSDFGKVMSSVMKELKGKADGRLIQDLVKKRLAGSP